MDVHIFCRAKVHSVQNGSALSPDSLSHCISVWLSYMLPLQAADATSSWGQMLCAHCCVLVFNTGESQVSRPPTTPLNQEPSRASAGFGSGSSSNSGSKAVSWVLGSSSCTATTARASPGAYDPDGDTQLSGLTGMSWGGGQCSAVQGSLGPGSGMHDSVSGAPTATNYCSMRVLRIERINTLCSRCAQCGSW